MKRRGHRTDLATAPRAVSYRRGAQRAGPCCSLPCHLSSRLAAPAGRRADWTGPDESGLEMDLMRISLTFDGLISHSSDVVEDLCDAIEEACMSEAVDALVFQIRAVGLPAPVREHPFASPSAEVALRPGMARPSRRRRGRRWRLDRRASRHRLGCDEGRREVQQRRSHWAGGVFRVTPEQVESGTAVWWLEQALARREWRDDPDESREMTMTQITEALTERGAAATTPASPELAQPRGAADLCRSGRAALDADHAACDGNSVDPWLRRCSEECETKSTRPRIDGRLRRPRRRPCDDPHRGHQGTSMSSGLTQMETGAESCCNDWPCDAAGPARPRGRVRSSPLTRPPKPPDARPDGVMKTCMNRSRKRPALARVHQQDHEGATDAESRLRSHRAMS